MLDLRKEQNFDLYITYIREPQKSLESWVEKYVSDYCMKRDLNSKNIIGKEANEIFRNKVTQLINCVKKTSERNEILIEDWLQQFNTAAEEIISLSETLFNVFDLNEVEVKDIICFKTELVKSLKALITSQEIVLDNWELKEFNGVTKQPHKLICNSILGCMKQCPLCKVICSCTIEHPGKDHTAPRHYPQGLRGTYRKGTKEFELRSCNELMASDGSFRTMATHRKSHKYKEYKSVNDYYASWSIAADTSLEASLYWKWVFAQFSEQFVEYYSKTKFRK
ncbi:unnamed protein product, partial [Meganyctiphanes norvegica]